MYIYIRFLQLLKGTLTPTPEPFPFFNCMCLPLSSELQKLIASNEQRMADLKQLSTQLLQKCREPCKDLSEIQPTTGTGTKKQNQSTDRRVPKHFAILIHLNIGPRLVFSYMLKINMEHKCRGHRVCRDLVSKRLLNFLTMKKIGKRMCWIRICGLVVTYLTRKCWQL